MKKFLTLLLLLTTFACQTEPRGKGEFQGLKLVTPLGDEIETRLVYTAEDQTQGLSGVKPEDFSDRQGMLFFYLADDEKHFWMPDTYFNLDLIYMDKDLRVLDIIRKLPHHIGRMNEDLIPRARGVWSRHTLEMKSGSKISESIKIGDQLTWKGKLTLQEADEFIRKEISGSK